MPRVRSPACGHIVLRSIATCTMLSLALTRGDEDCQRADCTTSVAALLRSTGTWGLDETCEGPDQRGAFGLELPH